MRLRFPFASLALAITSRGTSLLQSQSQIVGTASSRSTNQKSPLPFSNQTEFWRMMVRAVQSQDVQDLATRHSKDGIDGYAWATSEIPKALSVFLRLERDNDQLWAVEYGREDLKTSDEQYIEVR